MMNTSSDTSRHRLKSVMILAVVGCLGAGGCTTHKAELRQEIEVLLKQTMEEVRQETRRMDAEMEQIRSEVGRLRSDVGHVDAKVGRLETNVKHVTSEVTLLQTDAEKSDASLADLVVRVNQMDRRVGKADKPVTQNGERVARAAEVVAPPPNPPLATAPAAPERIEASKALKQGMSEQDVLRLFGNPHGIEKVLDSVYWYYGDGDLQGEYVKFDAKSGKVSGWSTFSPQHIQLDLRTTQ
jgi:septal ring factor EnvC (AmiA/AmiB activator)